MYLYSIGNSFNPSPKSLTSPLWFRHTYQYCGSLGLYLIGSSLILSMGSRVLCIHKRQHNPLTGHKVLGQSLTCLRLLDTEAPACTRPHSRHE
jgi:hypothetical protein